MRGVLAKRIRHSVYGDKPLRIRRRYARDSETGEIFNLGERGEYQTLKKSVKEDRKKGKVNEVR